MQLVLPDIKYKDSFISAVKEYKKEGGIGSLRYENYNDEEISKDFSLFVTKEHEKSEGKNLPEGYVAESNFWLIDNNEFIGRVSIRHTLTDNLLKRGGHIGYDIRPSKRRMGYGKKILELGLQKANDLGITNVLVTCNADNIASKKIIEENGGVFENSLEQSERKPKKLRYWIGLSK